MALRWKMGAADAGPVGDELEYQSRPALGARAAEIRDTGGAGGRGGGGL